LQDDRFDHDLPEVIARAELAGVHRFVCNASAPSDWEKTLLVAQQFSNVWPCLGVHPLYVVVSCQLPVISENDWLDRLEKILASANLSTENWQLKTQTAIGEIGLDHYVTPRDDALQESVFREQLRLATRLGKPVMLHTRHSLDRVLEILSEKFVEIPAFLLHSFSSPTVRLDKIVNMGGYFSFSANILKNHHKKARHAAATVPLNRVLLESDSPDLLPPLNAIPANWGFCPNDAYRNEPAILPAVLAELAKLRAMPIDELAAIIAENEAAFFETW
jgi:TatD DNase family protein